MASTIPRMPAPEVAVIKSVLARLAPGQIEPFASVAAAAGLNRMDPVFYRRYARAVLQLLGEGISIRVVPGEGFVRETAEQGLANVAGREHKSIQRKAGRMLKRIGCIDASQLNAERRAEFFAERTIGNLLYKASGAKAGQKMLAAAKIQSAQIPMEKALEVLKNGNE